MGEINEDIELRELSQSKPLRIYIYMRLFTLIINLYYYIQLPIY